MDFGLTDDQAAMVELAGQILTELSPPERLRAIEADKKVEIGHQRGGQVGHERILDQQRHTVRGLGPVAARILADRHDAA